MKCVGWREYKAPFRKLRKEVNSQTRLMHTMPSLKIKCLFGAPIFFRLAQCTSLPVATATNTYSTKVYNVSAATTTLTYQYTNEELAMLWNQVGSIAIGPITTTVEPTPEPSSYPRPGIFHPLVCPCSTIEQYMSDIAGTNIRYLPQ